MKVKLFIVTLLVCLAFQEFVFSHECVYLAPKHPVVDDTFFHTLIDRGNTLSETYQSIASYFKQGAQFCHRFQFKYPLKSKEQAHIFAKVLQIKAQQAHRFVPAISLSQFISAGHLGFIRKIQIAGNGPTIQEHVLVDGKGNQVIFIEESSVEPNGVMKQGSFAAWNGVIEENNSWYFAGLYLYNCKPDADDIQETVHMFRQTYENMMSFIENADVDIVYNQLSQF